VRGVSRAPELRIRASPRIRSLIGAHFGPNP
jgi:hypothetical protein